MARRDAGYGERDKGCLIGLEQLTVIAGHRPGNDHTQMDSLAKQESAIGEKILREKYMINSNVVKLSLAVLGGGFLLAACGDDVTKVTEVSKSGLEVVASADSLGKCTEEISGEMKFAQKENAVYVCSDSAWKNVSAVEKASCSAEPLKDSSGFKIVCDGDSVGVMRNGKDGLDGKKGEAGAAGTSCTVEESPLLESDFGRGGYLVVCGDEIVGTIRDGFAGEGCTLTDNGDGSVSQVCGSDTVTLYKAFCGNKPFNPASSFCYEDSVVALCGGKSYDLAENVCLADSLYPLCNGDLFDSEAQFCHGNALYEKCAGEIYDPDSNFCYGDSLVALCGGEIYSVGKDVCADEKVYKDKALAWENMNPEIDYEVLTDERDGRVYRTVRIGTQTWMAENLNYAYMPDTLSFCYNNSADSCAKYGRLYTWAAAMDSAACFTEDGKGCGYGKTCSPTYPVRGICPDGWHLPSDAEWNTLKTFVASSLFDGTTDSTGYALKSASGWRKSYNGKTGGSDAFGFGALPAGHRFGDGAFVGVLVCAYFWCSPEYGANLAYGWFLGYDFTGLYTSDIYNDGAMSVRCVKD